MRAMVASSGVITRVAGTGRGPAGIARMRPSDGACLEAAWRRRGVRAEIHGRAALRASRAPGRPHRPARARGLAAGAELAAVAASATMTAGPAGALSDERFPRRARVVIDSADPTVDASRRVVAV